MSAESFETHRSHLFSIAYRMLGSASEAEDMVQKAWVRWQGGAPDDTQSAKAWLGKVVVRLCLDQMRSARARREEYVGPWLPEPLLTHQAPDPESLSVAFLLLLERLSAAERAAYLLHVVFDYSHAEISELLDKEEAACRQLVHRAKRRIQEERPRFAPSRESHQRLLHTFTAALREGNVSALERLLSNDATAMGDGGGKVAGAGLHPVQGTQAVARLFVGLMRKYLHHHQIEVAEVNGWPALIFRLEGRVQMVSSIETDGETIFAVHNMVNPEKLARLGTRASERGDRL